VLVLVSLSPSPLSAVAVAVISDLCSAHIKYKAFPV
jgi:hypothetical protein